MDCFEEIGGTNQSAWMDAKLNWGSELTLIGRADRCAAEGKNLQVCLDQSDMNLDNAEIRAAVIRYHGFAVEYKSICKKLGVDIITREMKNRLEPEMHFKKMMVQSLESACSNQGWIDEGNIAYARGCGMSASEIHIEVRKFLLDDDEQIKLSTLDDELQLIDEMWEKYK